MKHQSPMHSILLYPLFLTLFLCTGCSQAVFTRGEYMAAYRFGDLCQAEDALNRTLAKQIPTGDYRRSNDAVWLLLDRATTRFAMGDAEGAIQDYNHALEAIDYYSQDSSVECFSKLLLEDDAAAYPGEDYEQILARVYFALALLHQGDNSNAYALLRQAEEVQQKKRELYRRIEFTRDYQLVDNAVAKYLMAAISENRGDTSNARILYRQTADLLGTNPENLGSAPADSENATVLIICHNGNAPFKISTTSTASVASAIALECILCSQKIDPAWSSMTGIPVPEFVQVCGGESRPTIAKIDGAEKPLNCLYDVGATAYYQLHQKMPVIVARGVARFLIRRAAVGCARNQDPGFGAFVDIGMLIANLNTKADTRSWTTLPNTIDLARFDLKTGTHTLEIQSMVPHCPPFTDRYTISLKPHDFCIINVFNIHPGVTRVLIPEQFINHQGDVP